MSWNSFVAGVDESPEGMWAAVTAWQLAERAGSSCVVVHAAPDVWLPVRAAADADAVRRSVIARATDRMLKALQGNVPEPCLGKLEVHIGGPAKVLASVADRENAELIVVGGKHHIALARWLGGSTAHGVVRIHESAVLVATSSTSSIERILAAVDLSEAAGQTIAAAERYAELFDAHLRVLHVVEPVPYGVEHTPNLEIDDLSARAEEVFADTVWPHVSRPGTDQLMRHGQPRALIAEEAKQWGAQLVVVGSTGHGWVDRMLPGSVTEGLLNNLPTSLLIVPIQRDSAGLRDSS
jgi:nucleotide-binding universal stress UspA family protein